MILNKENKDYYKKIIDHAEEFPNEEVCGTVSLDSNLIVNVNREKNYSANKENAFQISSQKVLGLKSLLGIYHSHPFTDENPSPNDKANSEEMGIPFLIYSLKTKKFFLYIPRSLEPSKFSGRPYVKGFHECVNIPRDYYSLYCPSFKMAYENFNYFPPFDAKEANKYMLSIFDQGFERRDKEEGIIKKDILIFYMANEKVFHVGVCCDNDYFYHQRAHHLSGKDFLDDKWQKRIVRVYRPLS